MLFPIRVKNSNIYIDSSSFFKWKEVNTSASNFEKSFIIPIDCNDFTIYLYDDNIKVREYCLQTEKDENFIGKYFLVSICISIHGNPAVPIVQIEGVISDEPNIKNLGNTNLIAYRMEVYFLSCAKENSKKRYDLLKGQDLSMKGLKYSGKITSSNTRLVGICSDCGKSFCFKGYSFYMNSSDFAYSDDGLDCCEIKDYYIDKDNWECKINDKVFRYYNSFNCPYCGVPYIDYKKFPKNKKYGVSGCVHIGKRNYCAD